MNQVSGIVARQASFLLGFRHYAILHVYIICFLVFFIVKIL